MIHVPITDDAFPSIEATFSYAPQGQTGLGLAKIQITATDGTTLHFAALPLNRWEKRARGAAVKQLVTAEQIPLESTEGVAARLVSTRHPELADATRGNALRRRESLLHLAKMAAEYAEATAEGAKNPAQVLGDRYGVSAATVRSWLHRARREGLTVGSTHPNATVNSQGRLS